MRDEFNVGTVIDEKYEVVALIGTGAMARVFRVRDLHLYEANEFAMKVLRPELAVDPAFVRRFFDEAAKASLLKHENVVRVEHVNKTKSGTPFLIMELLRRDLRPWMRHEPRLTWRHAAEIAREIARALEEAQRKGLVHCDLKPENVLTVQEFDVLPLKVADFGLAKATGTLLEKLSPSQKKGEWNAESVPGTPRYMSPEQASGRDKVSYPADVYSLGVMLFEMVSRKLPFGRIDTAEEALRVHEERKPESLRRFDDVPAALASLVEEMIDRCPERRPTATHVIDRLGRILSIPEPPPPPPPPQPDENLQPDKSQRRVLAAIAAVVIALGVLGYGLLRPRTAPEPPLQASQDGPVSNRTVAEAPYRLPRGTRPPGGAGSNQGVEQKIESSPRESATAITPKDKEAATEDPDARQKREMQAKQAIEQARALKISGDYAGALVKIDLALSLDSDNDDDDAKTEKNSILKICQSWEEDGTNHCGPKYGRGKQ